MESEVLQHLSDDHRHITEVLDALQRQLMAGDESELDHEVDWQIVSDILSYLQEYPDAIHHPLEDQLFDRVLDKGLTPAERELVHFNLAQHAEIVGATHRLAADVDNILNDIVVPVEQLHDHFVHYLELQRIHMRNENIHLFPLAQRLLTNQEWNEVGTEVLSGADPMFQLQLGKYASLYDYISSL